MFSAFVVFTPFHCDECGDVVFGSFCEVWVFYADV
jgi:hypothetical protein